MLPSLQRAGTRDITIFSDIEGVAGALSETGARHVGRAYAVEPVHVSRGVFHPKLTSLLGHDQPDLLLVGSGNLTFGGWGRNLELFEYLMPDAHPAAFKDAAAFLRGLSAASRVTLLNDSALNEHAGVLEAAGADAVEGQVRLVHNLEQGISDQIVQYAAGLGGAQRLTIASPYYGGPDAARSLCKRLGLDSFDVHVGQRLAVHGEHFRFDLAPEAAPVVLELLQPAEKEQRPLHAKLIEIVCAQGRLIISGSVNASYPALSNPDNVELAVLRIVENRQIFARSPHTSELPKLEWTESPVEQNGKGIILSASYSDGAIEGKLFSSHSEGPWQAVIDLGGERHLLGEVEVDRLGQFQLQAGWLEAAAYRTQRSTLVLRQGDSEAHGFVSFPDILTAARRLGGVAGSLLNIAGGADEDADWVVLLEWFAKNPEQTASGWNRPRTKSGPAPASEETVSVTALVPQVDQSPSFEHQGSQSAQSTLNRLLARLRNVLQEPSAVPNGRSSTDDEPEASDDKKKTPPDKKLIKVFDQVVEVLSQRVPASPAVELKRLGEIGIFMLLRRADEPERITEFLRHWLKLALTHLHLGDLDEELHTLALGISVLSAAFDRNPSRARRQLIDLCGSVWVRAIGAEPAPLAKGLKPFGLLAERSISRNVWEKTLEAALNSPIGLEDVPKLIAAVTADSPLPVLPGLAGSPHLDQLRHLLDKGRRDRIYFGTRATNSCPRCHQNFPIASLEDFKNKGLTRTECCNGIILRSDV